MMFVLTSYTSQRMTKNLNYENTNYEVICLLYSFASSRFFEHGMSISLADFAFILRFAGFDSKTIHAFTNSTCVIFPLS